MVEIFVNNLVNQMEKESLLKAEMREYYIYMLVVISEKWITILSILCLGFLMKKVIPTVLFLVCFIPLRRRTGGYHADKFWKCYLGTLIIYSMINYLCSIVVYHMNIVYCGFIISVFLISMMGTINHPNIAMNVWELQKSKQAARYMLGLECMVVVAMIILRMQAIYVCYMEMSIILCAVLMCVAKILKQEVICNEKE